MKMSRTAVLTRLQRAVAAVASVAADSYQDQDTVRVLANTFFQGNNTNEAEKCLDSFVMEASWLLGPIALGLLLSHAAAFAVHQGCYVSSADGVRAFPFKAAEGASMTVEACRYAITEARAGASKQSWLLSCHARLLCLLVASPAYSNNSSH